MSAAGRSGRGRHLVLWRHGRTPWNVENRFQGHTDVALDEVGVAQAAAAAVPLAALDPDLVVASDLGRARATAQALAELTGHEVEVDPGLRETSGGEWEGRTAGELREHDPERYGAWMGGEDVRAGGTGDSRSSVADRAELAVHRVLDRLPEGGTAVLVTHGGTARSLVGRLLGLPVEHWSALGGLDNCRWSVLAEVAARPQRAGSGRPAGPPPGEGDAVTGAARPTAGPVRWRLVEHNAGAALVGSAVPAQQGAARRDFSSGASTR